MSSEELRLKVTSNKFAFKNSEDLQFAFEASRRRVRNSEWLCDDLDKLRANEYDRVCVFCDNAGADVLGMTLLARELAKRTKVRKSRSRERIGSFKRRHY